MSATLGAQVRSLAFWTADRVRGGKIARHLRDLALLETDPALLKQRQAERLARLLTHACQTTSYYRQFAGATGLQDFPVLQKQMIREHHDDFISSRHHPGACLVKQTSGSYGAPLAFYLTREKASRCEAEVIHYASWMHFRVGARHMHTRTRATKSPLRLWMQNQVVIDPTHPSEQWLADQRRLLRTEPIAFLVGFPSAFASLAAYCQQCGDSPEDFSLQGVITNAEPLNERDRETIETAFGCPARSRYTLNELGVVAQECLPAKQHHLNEGSFVVELLELDRDAPVAPGQPGRIVVTDLWSHAMPLIRYDVGDVAVMAERCRCGRPGPVLTRIEGRIFETVYDAQGNRLSPFAINSRLQDLENVIQFQFVQQAAGEYLLRLCVCPAFAGEDTIRSRLLPLLGDKARLTTEYVPEIPPLRSGKRAYILNEMKLPRAA